jgi:hypothetical protein
VAQHRAAHDGDRDDRAHRKSGTDPGDVSDGRAAHCQQAGHDAAAAQP